MLKLLKVYVNDEIKIGSVVGIIIGIVILNSFVN